MLAGSSIAPLAVDIQAIALEFVTGGHVDLPVFLALTAETMVTDRPKKDAPPMMPGGGMGGMGGMDY
jgi:hypothetical protein